MITSPVPRRQRARNGPEPPYVTTGESTSGSAGAEALQQRGLAAGGDQPARVDAKRAPVGIWRSRFGAMPVPPVAPATAGDTGTARARGSRGRWAL